jgi:hypothetical protein
MTPNELARKIKISRQAITKACKKGAFCVGDVDYVATNTTPDGKFATWDIVERPRKPKNAGDATNAGGEVNLDLADPATIRLMKDTATLKKTMAQTQKIKQDLSDTISGHFSTWGAIAETALVNGFSEFSKRLMEIPMDEPTANGINKVVQECLKSSFHELQTECTKSVLALGKFDGE